MPLARAAGLQPARPGKPSDTAAIVQGLRRIVKALHTYSQDVRTGYGLTGPQLWALKTLQRDGRMPAGQRVEGPRVHHSSISAPRSRLVRPGAVRRTPPPTSRPAGGDPPYAARAALPIQ